MGHQKLYCVDYWPWPDNHPFFPDGFDWDLIDYQKFAKTHNQEHLLPPPPTTEGKVVQDESGVTWIEPEKYVSIIDMYIQGNHLKVEARAISAISDGSRVSGSVTNTRVPIGSLTLGMIGI